jgi:hypothetical protein
MGERGGAGWLVAVALTAVLLVVAAWEASVVFGAMSRPDVTLGMDFGIYMDRTRDWLAGDGFYLPHQLAGSYDVGTGTPPALYPPVLLLLTVPFTVLPAVLWWAIPLGVIGWSIRRAPWWVWPILALLLVYPRTWIVLIYGNPSLWAFAALAAGAGPLAALKPTLGPFALLGIRSRSWWLWAGVGLLVALPFGAMWVEYATAIGNARNDFGLEYLIGEWPIAAALVLATSARQGRASA